MDTTRYLRAFREGAEAQRAAAVELDVLEDDPLLVLGQDESRRAAVLATRHTSRLRDHFDDLVCARVDDANLVVDDEVLVAPELRHQ